MKRFQGKGMRDNKIHLLVKPFGGYSIRACDWSVTDKAKVWAGIDRINCKHCLAVLDGKRSTLMKI